MKCPVVLIKPVTGTVFEMPDAFGWSASGMSILIECKTSRSDFSADKRKPHRHPDLGMGTLRYYLAPSKVLKPKDMPEGWGLLTVGDTGKQIHIAQQAKERTMTDSRARQEARLLACTVRRTHDYKRVLSINPYTMQALEMQVASDLGPLPQ